MRMRKWLEQQNTMFEESSDVVLHQKNDPPPLTCPSSMSQYCTRSSPPATPSTHAPVIGDYSAGRACVCVVVPGAKISLALCCIFISRSISTICCSSLYASAHGTPKSSALVLTTQSVLPPRSKPLFSHELVVETVLVIFRRAEAGTMSCRAESRSYRDSSGASEISDSASESVLSVSQSFSSSMGPSCGRVNSSSRTSSSFTIVYIGSLG